VAAAGFNLVRLPVSWASLEPTAPTLDDTGQLVHTWNTSYLQTIDAVLAGFAAAGVSVIVDMHQAQWSPAFAGVPKANGGVACEGVGMPRWLYPGTPVGTKPTQAKCEFFLNVARPGVPVPPQDGLAAAWQVLAADLAHQPAVVGVDLLNEPGWGGAATGCTATGAMVDDFFTRVGTAVQQVAPDLLLIEEDGTWSNYAKSGFLLTRPLALQNVVYSWHLYANDWTVTRWHQQTGQQQYQAHLNRARQWQQPFFLGEFDAFRGAYNRLAKQTDPNWQADLAGLMADAKANGVSWALWQWYGGAGGLSLVDPATGQPKPALLAGLQAGL
jgi:aryl-phospho-beta-D-glucosidase BglC (GH1 family)